MKINVGLLDRQITFCVEQATTLRRTQVGQRWAESRCQMFDGIAETLRQVRQDQQMTGVGGKRIDEQGPPPYRLPRG